mgnify:CR=1 FL=1
MSFIDNTKFNLGSSSELSVNWKSISSNEGLYKLGYAYQFNTSFLLVSGGGWLDGEN